MTGMNIPAEVILVRNAEENTHTVEQTIISLFSIELSSPCEFKILAHGIGESYLALTSHV